MTQNEVEAFLEVIECGSISAAAQKLYLGQSTVSARIRALEEELNVSLFTRSRGRKNTELTLEGKNFEPLARKWKKLWEDTNEAIACGIDRNLVIASGYTINAYIMPKIYCNLSEEIRASSFQFLTYHYNEIFRMVEAGEADFGFVSNYRYSKSVRTYTLFTEEMVLLAGNRECYPDVVKPEDLNIRNEIYIEWDESFEKWHKYWFGSSKLASVQSENVTFVKEFLHMARNWAIVPITVANILCQEGDLHFSHLQDQPEPRISSLAVRDSMDNSPVIQEFLALMKEVVESLGGRWVYEPQKGKRK